MAGAFVAMILFVILGFFMLMGLIFSAASAKPPSPDNVVLSLDLNYAIPDQAPLGGFAAFSGTPGFTDILLRLKAAETDDAIKGIYLRGSFSGIGTSRAEELRAAFESFKKSGKFIVAHTQGMFGYGGPSAFHSISSADETPSGRSTVILGPVNHFLADTCQPIHRAMSRTPRTIGA
jgi:protease-4